jgi:indolepyruvate decarboxylase
MNLARTLLQALKDHGADGIFGIPGDFALPFFKEIEESCLLPLYTLSHEPGVGFAADGAARASGRIGVAAVTYGAGALNLVNPIASAFAEKSPVVVISGAPGRGEASRGLLLHHQAKTLDSQFRMFQEITCAQTRLDDAAEAPAEIARVLRACIEEARPVYIELPRDMVGVPCGPVVPLPPSPVDAAAVDACLDEVMARLEKAVSPVLMVGVEVRRHGLEAEVAELARRLDLPVVTPFMGQGLLSHHRAPLRGTYLGVAGDPEITRLVEDSDALIMLGLILSDTNFGVSSKTIDLGKALLFMDGRGELGYHHYLNIPLKALVRRWLARVADRPEAAVAPPLHRYPEHLADDDGALSPTDIACAVNDLFRAEGALPLATDMGDCLFTSVDIRLEDIVAPAYYATMGFGVPAGLGVQAATGRRPLILVGDGAFQMTGWELGNCARLGLDPIVIVLNNLGWEMLRVFQPGSTFNDLGEWRYADLAGPLGGDGHRVATRRELKAALAKAAATRGRFQLIEAMIPGGVLSETLGRFVAGVKRVSAG